MAPKYPSRDPVLRRRVMHRYRKNRESYFGRKDGMEFATLTPPEVERQYLRNQLAQMNKRKGRHLTLLEARDIERHREMTIGVRAQAEQKGMRMSLHEAGKVIDVFHYLLKQIPKEKQEAFARPAFIELFLNARKKRGKPLRDADITRLVLQMEKRTDVDFGRAFLLSQSAGIRSPRSEGILGPRGEDLFARAKKEQQLGNESLQRQMLMGEFNRRLGDTALAPRPGDTTRREIREAVQRIAHREYADSLKAAVRKKIRHWDRLSPREKNKILRRYSMQELGNLISGIFNINRRIVARGREGVESSQWILDSLARPENRLYLARLAMKWYGPKPKKK
ncbi:MAG: hypothetical protein IPJ89_01455 [Candidatus Iainarchaeum archaeon]|uniref:Uncharacterized protein n=1 Tax=Candidatus Iainarchaeum sp. TaxID=3101447 RepID=A0A7T9DKB2_9ARCH|nr:MAG: hypothetical protein IPJ89_01455 [Candidatus Diapherotrites archaeon]